MRGLEEWRDRFISPKDSKCLFRIARTACLPPSPQELWNFPALLTVPFAVCLHPPSGPHRWSPACPLPLQQLPTTYLFITDSIFLPSLPLPLYIFSISPFVSPPFFPIPISHDLLCLFFTFVPVICPLPPFSLWSPKFLVFLTLSLSILTAAAEDTREQRGWESWGVWFVKAHKQAKKSI